MKRLILFLALLVLPGAGWTQPPPSSNSTVTADSVNNWLPALKSGHAPNLPVNSMVNGVPIGTGGGVTDGDKGDITVSGGGTVWSVDSGAIDFSELAGKPTTIAGYGITDFNSLGDARWSLLGHTHTFASLTSKPTTAAGYGITNGATIDLWGAIAPASKQDTITTGTTAQYFRGDLSLATFPTNVSSFTNDAGYLTGVTVNAPLSGAGTGASHLSMHVADTTHDGYLSSTDWNTFNNKQPAGSYGDFSSNTSTSVDGEVVLFSGTAGKTGKRAIGSGLATLASGVLGTTANNSSNWDTAYTERHQWDGGSTNLNASTGRTSLGLGTAATHAATDFEVPLTFSQSLSRSTNTVTLSGDSATPGDSKYYGTNGSGTRGFYDLPTGFSGLYTDLDFTSGNITSIPNRSYDDLQDLPSLGPLGRQEFSDEDVTVSDSTRLLAQIGTLTAARLITLPLASSYQAGTTLVIVDESGTLAPTNSLGIATQGADHLVIGSILDTTYGPIITPGGRVLLTSNGLDRWTLTELGSSYSVTPNGATLQDDLGQSSIDLKRHLIGPSNLDALEWDTRTLKANDGSTVAVDWSDTTKLQFFTGASYITNAGVYTGDGSGLTNLSTSQITASTDKNFVTDAQQTVLGNTSNTNSGDQYGGVTASGALQYLRRNAGNTAYEFGALPTSGDMFKADNLSGLANYTTARSNLGLGTLATQNGTFSGTSSGTNTGDQTADGILGLSSNGLVKRTGTNAYSAVTDNSSNWDTAYTDRLKWDGGATGLTAATGRTSLALSSSDSPQFTGIELGNASDTTLSRASAGVLAVEGVNVLLNGGALGTPSSGTLTNCTFPTLNQNTTGSAATLTTARNLWGVSFNGSSNIGGAIELGTAGTTDTTLDRSGAGAATIEGVAILLNGGAAGTPSSITLTNGTGLPVSGITSSASTALGVGSLELGHASDTTLSRASAGVLAVEGVNVLLNGGALGTPSSGTLTNATGLPVSGITASTSTALGVGSIELGHASDTTISRVSAGVAAVEGANILVNGGALGTPSSATLTNATGLPVSGITASTSTALGVGSVELGHASDTTLSRASAGVLAVEGVNVLLNGGALGTPSSGSAANLTSFPTLNQNTTGSAASLSVSGQTGKVTVTGLASTDRAKTVRDAADTILELGGSYTPTGTWTNMTLVTPTLGTPASATLTNATGLPDAGVLAATTTTAVPTNTGGWTEYKVSGSDFTQTNQTLADITGLVTGTLSTSSTYLFEAMLILTTSADTTGMKFGVNCTGTGSPSATAVYSGTTTATAANTAGTTALNTADGSAFLTSTSSAGFMDIKGSFTTGTGSPAFSIQVLKVTSGTATVKVGSKLWIRKL